ncbi:stability determinant [Klebsiella michiganensis]
MTTKLSPIVSEFETQEQADSYDRWFRAKVQAALDDPRPGIPHDDAMAKLEAMLEERRTLRTKRAMG